MSKRERQDGTGRDGTRSHFQVGFRTARPLEGTSNDSDIAAREFKSLTPSGSLSTRPRIACLLRFLRVCLYTYTSISLSISPSTRSKGGKKIFRIQSGLIKYSILHGRSIFARIETESILNGVYPPFPMENSVLSKGFIIVILLVRRSSRHQLN